MSEISVNALAKINLGLDIVSRLPNGYHEVDMIMQTVKLYDTVDITTRADDEITISCSKDFVPTDESNLAYRAAQLLKRLYPEKVHGVDIRIKKVIPVAAGMAGGSTDAAAVLYGMNELYDLQMRKAYMMQISLELGADVPFCLFRGTARSTGIGERLERLSPIPRVTFLIAKPKLSVSTAEAYKAYDSADDIVHPDIDALAAAIEAGDLDKMTANMGNVLEQIIAKDHPVIGDIERMMKENGALASMMTGSGPAVFGIFTDIEKARASYNVIGESGLSKGLYICSPYQI